MARHPFDPVSFVLGGVAIASGAVVLADRSLTDDARVLLPAGLIALGIALFAKVVRGDTRPIPADPAPTSAPVPTPPAVVPPGPGPTLTGGDPASDQPGANASLAGDQPEPEDASWSTACDDPTPEDAPRPTAGDPPGVPGPAEPAEAVDRSARQGGHDVGWAAGSTGGDTETPDGDTTAPTGDDTEGDRPAGP